METIAAPVSESLSLAKALAVKNRLAGRLAQAKSNIETYNSVLVGQAGEESVDVRAEFDRYRALQAAIIAVKSAVQRANGPILDDILLMGELKARLALLAELNTKSGSEPTYTGVVMTYVATFTKPEVLTMTRRLEAEIDALQDKLNAHNALARVELPTSVLELAR